MPVEDMEAVASRLFASAPGPSPWYVSRWPRVGDLEWRKEPSGVVYGETPDGRRLFEVPMSAYLLGAAVGEVTLMTNNECVVEVTTYRFDSRTPPLGQRAVPLPPHRSWPESVVRTSAEVVRVMTLDPRSESREIPTMAADSPSLAEEVAFPARLPTGTPPATMENPDPRVHRVGPARPVYALCVWRPRTGRVRVVPLPWFNEDSMDLGYQWITCCARDPESGLIFGEGIRVGRFAVDESGAVRWSKSEPFWMSPG